MFKIEAVKKETKSNVPFKDLEPGEFFVWMSHSSNQVNLKLEVGMVALHLHPPIFIKDPNTTSSVRRAIPVDGKLRFEIED